MSSKNVLWILAPLALSVGVIWMSAQEPKDSKGPEGVKVGELAEKLQQREKALAQKEMELKQLEQRLATLQGALDRDRQELQAREKTVQEATEHLEALRTRPPIDPQLTRTYEAMDPVAGSKALRELARLNQEVSVSLLAGMAPKKAARLLDQLAGAPDGDPKLAALLSEKVGLSRPKAP